MSLDSVHVALQGLFAPTPIFVAVQGLLEQLRRPVQPNTDQGMSGKRRPAERNYYVEWLNREFYRKQRIKQEDELAVEFITTVLQMEILNG